jgi:hypothetical protein
LKYLKVVVQTSFCKPSEDSSAPTGLPGEQLQAAAKQLKNWDTKNIKGWASKEKI